jgi:MraZ protein
MFSGENRHTIDKKGRIILPAGYREDLEQKYIDKLVVTRGFDDCLYVFPMNEWKDFEAKLKTLPMNDADTRYVIRMFYANASETNLDKQGRMFIPSDLREKVGITKDVIITGYFNRIEVWAKEKWDVYIKKDKDKPFGDVVQKLFDTGIMK